MQQSYTGIIYMFSSLIFLFGSYKFYNAWAKQKNLVSKIFAWLFFAISTALFIDGAIERAIFFKKPELLYWTAVDGFITFAIVLGMIGYLAVFLKFPKISPKYGFITIFLSSIIVGILNIIDPVTAFIRNGEIVSWNFNPIVGILGALVCIVPSVPIIVSFFEQARAFQEKTVRKRAVGFGIAFLLVVITSSAGVVFAGITNSNPTFSDIGLLAVSFIILFTFLFVPNVGQVPQGRKTN